MAQLLRSNDNRVGFVGLSFDPVIVYAITRVSHHLLHQHDSLGAVHAGLMFLAVWWVRVCTTWARNTLNPDAPAVRGMLFVLMALGLYVSMAIPDAFAERGLIFALAFVAMNWLRTGFVYLAAGNYATVKRTFARIMAWFVASAVFWIRGGRAEPQAWQWFWLVAPGIEYRGPMAGFAVPGLGRDRCSDWALRGGHIAERAGLFVIICRGKALLVAGATFAQTDWSLPGHAAFLAPVGVAVGMWWGHVNVGHRHATRQIEHSANPGHLARLAFTYAHLPIVAGVVLAAVGAERTIAHPGDPGNWAEAATLIGGAALFVAGNAWFKWISGADVPLSHLVGWGLSVALALASPCLTLLWLTTAAAAVPLVVAVWEHRSLRGGALPA